LHKEAINESGVQAFCYYYTVKEENTFLDYSVFLDKQKTNVEIKMIVQVW